jgi:hypothetical protein
MGCPGRIAKRVADRGLDVLLRQLPIRP